MRLRGGLTILLLLGTASIAHAVPITRQIQVDVNSTFSGSGEATQSASYTVPFVVVPQAFFVPATYQMGFTGTISGSTTLSGASTGAPNRPVAASSGSIAASVGGQELFSIRGNAAVFGCPAVTCGLTPVTIPYGSANINSSITGDGRAPTSVLFTSDIDTLAIEPGVSVGFSQTLTGTITATQTFDKNPEYVANHKSRADIAKAKGATLSGFGLISAGDTLTNSFLSFIATGLEDSENSVATVISVALAIGVGFFAGPLGVAVAAAYSLLSAFYAVQEQAELKLANDPPDSNYTQIYVPETPMFDFDLGLGDELNAFFRSGATELANLTISLDGELKSLERAQGALLAGDDAAAAAQFSAALSYRDQYDALILSAGQWMGSIESTITNGGYDSHLPLRDEFYGITNSMARDYGAEPLPVPEPSTIFLFGFGMIGVLAARNNGSSPVRSS
jgi:hypothetical protein